jgi:hypothetical protein
MRDGVLATAKEVCVGREAELRPLHLTGKPFYASLAGHDVGAKTILLRTRRRDNILVLLLCYPLIYRLTLISSKSNVTLFLREYLIDYYFLLDPRHYSNSFT